MASFRASLATPWPVDRAFDFMADARNFERWDPGTISSRQVTGAGPGLDAEFDVEVRSVGSPLVLRYRTTQFDPPIGGAPGTVQLEATSRRLIARDRIEVERRGVGAAIHYDAGLELRGAWKVFAPFLALAFRRIGERGFNGLMSALEGERIRT
jgi:hypothetical protein